MTGAPFLLDTDVCVYLLNGRAAGLASRLRTLRLGDVATTTVSAAELRFGALKSGRPQANLERVEAFLGPLTRYPFTDAAATEFARGRWELHAGGTPIGTMDLLIAAIARSIDATLVTNNRREFARLRGLRLSDWRIDET